VRFVDTNILLYAISTEPDESSKRETANRLLGERDLALSTQVLQEFYVQATRSTRRDRITHRQAADLVLSFSRFPVQAATLDLVQSALEACERYVLSYWDAAIVEAVRLLGCTELLSEDLNDGQSYGGVVVKNPFQ
jgi:predicted nucleic acid-binding protein